ncbi:MAG: DUF6599 family protein [Thermodesulfovibrionales bacterium]
MLLLLPCIAVGLYLEGQRYDPALLDFKALPKKTQADTSSESESSPKVLSQVSGYSLIGRQREYKKENLHEHVNGHAEYFIGMGFKRLTVYEYSRSESQPEIQVEVFDMGKPLHAFGVLMDVVGAKAVAVDIGTIGYQTQGAIIFTKSDYYVRVIPYKKGLDVSKFAREFESLLPTKGKDSLDVLKKLPKLGRIVSTRYIKEGYRGLEFLNNVIERQYERDGKQIQLALILAGDDESQRLLNSAIDFVKRSGAEYQRVEGLKNEVYRISDRYEGDWIIIRSKDMLLCLFGDFNEEVIQRVAGVR